MSPPVNRPRRIEYLDLYRAIAIMAVVAIHATSTAVAHYPKNTWDHDLFYFWNTFLQFAVPAFLFLSSLVLFYNYSAKLNEKGWIVSFYKKRMFYIFVPYVAWSLIYFVIKKLAVGKEPLADSIQFVKQLALGTAHTHLYFFLIILQFYIVFPWILYLTKQPWFKKYLPLYFIAAQALFYVLNVKFHFERTGSLLPSYLIVIGFGAWMGLSFEWLMKKMMRLRYVLLVSLISGAAISMYASGIIKTTLIEWPILMYSVLFIVRNVFTLSACLVLLVVSEKVGTRGRRSEYKVSRFTDSLGTVAFGIFLIHPLILMVWRHVLTDDFARHFSLGVILSFIAALLLSWLCAMGLRRLKWGWVLIGR
ncbi:acyltransferase [Paenibacillus polysaccharolyticus]|uniref:acyltransferase n=1 Tax=Paenibacillus polysaccharolyticus TaxID=582692 RepID=UPI002042205B|nr:acyltransferase [Paenibacillus polysaccharolyticus]MCM3133128.1 acyltransferase [Paenibacillus polysaccharolyticus]